MGDLETTAEKLKVGDKLILGAYSTDPNDFIPPPITWIKADKENEFISEYVLDFLKADAIEPVRRTDGRPRNDYWTLNIVRWLNSSEIDWYEPAHESDRPPYSPYPFTTEALSCYKDNPGFLARWRHEDIQMLEVMEFSVLGTRGTSLVRLPSNTEIHKSGMQLFHRKGLRTTATDSCHNKAVRYGFDYFVPYWLTPKPGTECMYCLTQNSMISWSHVNNGGGVRPIIKVKFDAPVCKREDGIYVPVGRTTTFSEADISALLGLA